MAALEFRTTLRSYVPHSGRQLLTTTNLYGQGRRVVSGHHFFTAIRSDSQTMSRLLGEATTCRRFRQAPPVNSLSDAGKCSPPKYIPPAPAACPPESGRARPRTPL